MGVPNPAAPTPGLPHVEAPLSHLLSPEPNAFVCTKDVGGPAPELPEHVLDLGIYKILGTGLYRT